MAAPVAPEDLLSAQVSVCLTWRDMETLDLLRARMAEQAGRTEPLDHSPVMRMALRYLAAAWGIETARSARRARP